MSTAIDISAFKSQTPDHKNLTNIDIDNLLLKDELTPIKNYKKHYKIPSMKYILKMTLLYSFSTILTVFICLNFLNQNLENQSTSVFYDIVVISSTFLSTFLSIKLILIMFVFKMKHSKNIDIYKYLSNKIGNYLSLSLSFISNTKFLEVIFDLKTIKIIKTDNARKIIRTTSAGNLLEMDNNQINLFEKVKTNKTLFTNSVFEIYERSFISTSYFLSLFCFLLFVCLLISYYLEYSIFVKHLDDRITDINQKLCFIDTIIPKNYQQGSLSIKKYLKKCFCYLKNPRDANFLKGSTIKRDMNFSKKDTVRRDIGENESSFVENGALKGNIAKKDTSLIEGGIAEGNLVKKDTIPIKDSILKGDIVRNDLSSPSGFTIQSDASLLRSDFTFCNENQKEGILHIFDTNNDQEIDINEFITTISSIIAEKRRIQTAIHQNKTCLTKIIIFTSITLTLFFIYHINSPKTTKDSKFQTGTLGLFVSMSFIFKDALSNIIQSLIFICLVRPFDAGDHIILDNICYCIFEMGLQFTTLKSNNKYYTVPNKILRENKIINLRKSTFFTERFEIIIQSEESLKKNKNLLKDGIYDFLITNKRFYKTDFQISHCEIIDFRIIKFFVEIDIHCAYQNLDLIYDKKFYFIEFMDEVFRQHRISAKIFTNKLI